MENKMKKKKRKSRYSVVLVSHSSEKGLKQVFLSSWYARTAMILILTLLIGLSAYGIAEGFINGSILQGNSEKVESLNKQVEELTEANNALTIENTDLKDKNAILVTTINEKLADEEALAAKSMPTGFPILGTTSIIEEPTATSAETVADYVPIVVFEAGKDVSIISSGNGTVTDIVADAVYGYSVILDHGNGYISIYRFSSVPSVRIGDEITRGTMLGVTTADSEKVGYQITLDGAYINPMDIMEIYG